MILKLQDDWREPTSLLQAFKEAMRGPVKDKGNPPTEFNIKDLPVGKEVKVKRTDKLNL